LKEQVHCTFISSKTGGFVSMKKIAFLILLVPLIFAGKAITKEVVPDAHDAHAYVDEAQYVGATRCRTCHRKEEQGEQYPKWEEGPHAGAYASLASDKGKEVAAAAGIDNPQEAGECLKCHITAYGVDESLLDSRYDIEEGVSCEACHGAGSEYRKKSTMEEITRGEIEGASVGLIEPNEEVCIGCHNDESPTFEGFNFEEKIQEINHPIPDARKAEYQ